MVHVKTALLSTYYKSGLEPLAKVLGRLNVALISTGGTLEWLHNQGLEAQPVENLTQFPEMLGGRVKTLHPKIFGGILNRRENALDQAQLAEFDFPPIDLVVVNLYPFEETVASGGSHDDIIEKIDIGGVSLLRAAAKNYRDVVVVASPQDYQRVADELTQTNGFISESTRKLLATKAFKITAAYDTAIANHLSATSTTALPELFSLQAGPKTSLRYGENPHQKAAFYGDLSSVFEQLHGKELSYNNLVDVASAIELLAEFDVSQPTVAIIKHTNACGVAIGKSVAEAYARALSCDPVSAFGGVIVANQLIDKEAALLLHTLFFEILCAPAFTPEALEVLAAKKNRILLVDKQKHAAALQIKSLFGGVLVQEKDVALATKQTCTVVTNQAPSPADWENLLFANKIVKHTKSNTIVLAKDGILVASGTGQTSRVDALKQAIEKATNFGMEVKGCALASDAFFPFPDCVEIAAQNGISSIIQPGGSIKDQDSIDACNKLGISMVTTGLRHFKH